MPYEIASAFVRVLCLHWKELQDAKLAYKKFKASDEEEANQLTRRAKLRVGSLRKTVRYIIMNSRTRQMATQEWVSKHVQVDKDGVPMVKTKKIQPWIMVLHFEIHNQIPLLEIQLMAKAPKCSVRCLEIASSEEKSELGDVLGGYSFEEEDDEASEAESLPTQIGDEAGLEGSVVHQVYGMRFTYCKQT